MSGRLKMGSLNFANSTLLPGNPYLYRFEVNTASINRNTTISWFLLDVFRAKLYEFCDATDHALHFLSIPYIRAFLRRHFITGV